MSNRKSSKHDDALFKQACPACGAAVSLDPALAGHKVQCPKCLNEIICTQAAFETEIAESPAPAISSRRLSAADKNLYAQVKRLKQQAAELAAQVDDLQNENVRSAKANAELQRKLESAQAALREFSDSVLTLIEIQENVYQLGRDEKTGADRQGAKTGGWAASRAAAKR